MSLYVPEGTPPIITNAMARIERRLPHPGEVLVREGTRVEPEDRIGRAFQPVPPQVVSVAQMLAIPPSLIERVMAYEVGDKVNQGEELARAGLLTERACPSPVSGIIVTIDPETGYVTIAPDPLEVSMTANIRGVVMEVFPYEGVLIETLASQVYGVFGIGEERNGVLQFLPHAVIEPTAVTQETEIDIRNAYAILVGGAGITAPALIKAVQSQVRGIIVGGIDEQELRAFLRWSSQQTIWSTYHGWRTGVTSWHMPNPRHAADPGLTILVTEGFGIHPISQPIFELLSARDRQEAFIDGTTQLRQRMRRPRLVLSVARSGEAQIEPPRSQIRTDALVRLLDATHLGHVATIRSVSTIPVTLGSGIRTMAVEVVQEEAPPFWVPRTAVEVLN